MSKWRTHLWDTCVWHKSSIPVTSCRTLLARGVFFRRLSRVQSDNRENCAWSCGALSRLLRRVDEKSISSLSSSLEAELGCPSSDTVGPVVSVNCLLPRLICRRLLNIQAVARSPSSRVSRYVEVAVSTISSRRASRGRCSRRPAVTASCGGSFFSNKHCLSCNRESSVVCTKSFSRMSDCLW